MFYSVWMEQFPDVSCPRCETWGQLYTVPLRLVSAGGTAWQALCAECFRSELKNGAVGRSAD
jgi:hypothetical protein